MDSEKRCNETTRRKKPEGRKGQAGLEVPLLIIWWSQGQDPVWSRGVTAPLFKETVQRVVPMSTRPDSNRLPFYSTDLLQKAKNLLKRRHLQQLHGPVHLCVSWTPVTPSSSFLREVVFGTSYDNNKKEQLEMPVEYWSISFFEAELNCLWHAMKQGSSPNQSVNYVLCCVCVRLSGFVCVRVL